jgi:hypothetical protein
LGRPGYKRLASAGFSSALTIVTPKVDPHQ